MDIRSHELSDQNKYDTPSSSRNLELVVNVPAGMEKELSTPGIKDTAEVWKNMIDSAKKSIDFEEYYINLTAKELHPNDSSVANENHKFDEVFDALKAASQRGVKIRMVVDKGFFQDAGRDRGALALAALPNVQIETANFGSDNPDSNQKGIQHSKFFVVDGKSAFEGSQNFDWISLEQVHETGLLIRDENMAGQLDSIFESDWQAGTNLKTGRGPSNTNDDPDYKKQVTSPDGDIVASPCGDSLSNTKNSLSEIEQMIDQAKRSLQINTYELSNKYYLPSSDTGYVWNELDDHIKAAAKRGVSVQILVDQSAVSPSDDLHDLNQQPNIQVREVEIPQLTPVLDFGRTDHSKFMLTDGAKTWIGSENFEKFSFTQSRNIGVVSSEPEIANNLENNFQKLWSYSKPLD